MRLFSLQRVYLDSSLSFRAARTLSLRLQIPYAFRGVAEDVRCIFFDGTAGLLGHYIKR
jgi:hypothetical protein